MASSELLAEIARQERLHEWMLGLEQRISSERRRKVLTSLRRELEKCQCDAEALAERITRLESDAARSQAS